jgi:hypothetical protein
VQVSPTILHESDLSGSEHQAVADGFQFSAQWDAASLTNTGLSYHDVQLPSYNMSEYYWIYLDPLGEIRLSQATTSALDSNSVSTTVTLDLADLSSPYGSVHNRQKQQVGHRVALNVLATGYGKKGVNTGPSFAGASTSAAGGLKPAYTCRVQRTCMPLGCPTLLLLSPHIMPHAAEGLVVEVHTDTVAGAGGGKMGGSNDCTKCCAESAFEISADGKVWVRTAAPPGQPAAPNAAGIVRLTLAGTFTPNTTKWVRYVVTTLSSFFRCLHKPFFARSVMEEDACCCFCSTVCNRTSVCAREPQTCWLDASTRVTQ